MYSYPYAEGWAHDDPIITGKVRPFEDDCNSIEARRTFDGGLHAINIANAPLSMQNMAAFLSTCTESAVLRHALGFSIPGCPDLSNDILAIVIDTENFRHSGDKLTEVGLVVIDSREMRQLASTPGPHGEKLFDGMYYYHFRLLENAHLFNRNQAMYHSSKTHFGQTRFVTGEEMFALLTECFAWPIDPEKPELGNCPVVCMGHSVQNDIRMLNKTIGWDMEALGTVVAIVDTQTITKDMGLGPQISLKALTQHFDVRFRDGHSAGNDAAYTAINGTFLVLEREFYPMGIDKDYSSYSRQDMVRSVERYSQTSATPTWGIPEYCTRCGSKDHSTCTTRVQCSNCAKAARVGVSFTHTDALCSWLPYKEQSMEIALVEEK